MPYETETPAAKTPLRWYQYRLRTLLIAMTLLAAWMAYVSHHARQQKLAVEKIRALGGTVQYDYQKDKIQLGGEEYSRYDPQAMPPGPEWLRNFIGNDYFQNVVYVSLSKTSVTDDELAILENFPGLEGLSISQTKITSFGLVHLEGLKNLESLSLENTLIDDNGLAHIKDLANLRILILNDTKITDAGTINLQRLTNLEECLWLESTQITDGSLKYFKNFKKLKWLNMTHTRVTEKAANELQKDLPKTKISFHHAGSCLD
jgi:hypothetical protein